MNAQAEQMKGYVEQWTAIVGSAGQGNGPTPGHTTRQLLQAGVARVHQAVRAPEKDKKLLIHKKKTQPDVSTYPAPPGMAGPGIASPIQTSPLGPGALPPGMQPNTPEWYQWMLENGFGEQR